MTTITDNPEKSPNADISDHEAKARELAEGRLFPDQGETVEEFRKRESFLVYAIASALREAEARATLVEREAWQTRMKTASDLLAQMTAAGMSQEKRNELIGCLDPQILRTDDDMVEMEAQAAAIRSRNDE